MLFLTFICFFPSPPQAPFTPFITEMMYQNLRHLIDPDSVEEKDAGSIHYLMLPQVRWEKFTSSFCCWPTCNHFSTKCRDAILATLSKHGRNLKYRYLAWWNLLVMQFFLITLSDARYTYVKIHPQLMGQHLQLCPSHLAAGFLQCIFWKSHSQTTSVWVKIVMVKSVLMFYLCSNYNSSKSQAHLYISDSLCQYRGQGLNCRTAIWITADGWIGRLRVPLFLQHMVNHGKEANN